MTTSPPAPSADAGPDRASAPVPPGEVRQFREPDLILARTHLRLGSLSLARTELETMAGLGTLDDDAIRDLAEARWRTGDLAGAGVAAAAWLEGHPEDVLGLVIAAEAQSALGRPGDARRIAGLALERANGSLDPVFAGMQRSSIWPVEPGTGAGPVGALFDDLHPGPRPLPRGARFGPGGRGGGDSEPHEPFDPGVPEVFGGRPGLWAEDADGGLGDADDDALDPTVLFHRGRVALEAGRSAEAATGLLLALRTTPGLAPAILDLLSGRSDPILVLVRGDAQRIVGHEIEAERDHAAAAGSLADHGPDGGSGPIHGEAAAPPDPSATAKSSMKAPRRPASPPVSPRTERRNADRRAAARPSDAEAPAADGAVAEVATAADGEPSPTQAATVPALADRALPDADGIIDAPTLALDDQATSDAHHPAREDS